jgi:hypothetical protein
VLPSPLLNPKEEVTFRASRSISRTAKPPSLHLQRSNGSTAASISSVSTNADDSPLDPSKISPPPPIPPFSKLRNSQDKQKQPTEQSKHDALSQGLNIRNTNKKTLSQDSIDRKPLPLVKSPQGDRPLPSLPAPSPPPERPLPRIDNALQQGDNTDKFPELSKTSIADHHTVALADENTTGTEGDMKRFKDMVKRKPVRSDSNATVSPTTNNVINKENRPFYSSPMLGTFISGMIHPSRANLTDASLQPTTVSSKSASNESSTLVSPADSTVHLPDKSTPEPAAASISQETVIAALRDDLSDDDLQETPSTPRLQPALLPQASPMTEESPSKYGIKKRGEMNIQVDADKSVNNRRSRAASGIDQYKVCFSNITICSCTDNTQIGAENLRMHVAGLQDEDEDSIAFHDIVLANEAKRDKFLHPSIMHLTSERPLETTAPKISTIQLHCYVNHSRWLENNNSALSPIDCALCYRNDQDVRHTCTFCALRVCTGCRDRIDMVVRSHTLKQKIYASIEESTRLREQKAARDGAQRALVIRPPSMESSYDAGDLEPPNRGHSGMSMRSVRSTGNMRGNGPYYGGLAGAAGASGIMRQYQSGVRRFSQGNVPAPIEYPPPPPQRMLAPNTPITPRGRSPTSRGPQGNGRGYPTDYSTFPPQFQPRNNIRMQQGGGGYNGSAGYNGMEQDNFVPPARPKYGVAATARREKRGQDTMKGVYIG